MPIKGRTRALLERVGRAGTRTRQTLSWGRSLPSPAWTLVTPYCKRTRPGRGTNTKAAGFPPLSRRSPAASLRARPRARPIWAGARGDTHSSAQGTPPVSERRQSSSYFTASEDSDLGLPDSPTLDLIISKFLMTLRLNPYSKVVLLQELYEFNMLTLGKFFIFLKLQSSKVSLVQLFSVLAT
jgi:hypothetical protein